MTDQIEALRVALGGRYRVEREAGSGGMATVYLARDAKHDRDVALKVLHPDLAASIGADRFLREIHITAGLQHPHVLPLYDSGEAGGFLYYVMPFVEGETLDHVLEREGQLPIREAVRYVREAAEALAYAHGHGLIHRDLKPGNIFISGGHAILADFGIARALEEAGSEKLTQTGTAVGTPAYMSPEQATGQVNLDARSDIYSLGCVLYEALVGQIPFTGRTPMAIMARHSADQVPPPHIMRDTISEELEEVIYRCLAKSPADRYRTAAELAEALKEVEVAGTGARPRAAEVAWTTPYGARRARWRGWRPGMAGAAAVGALAVVGLSWAMWPPGNAGDRGLGPEGLDPRRVAVLYFEDLSGGGLTHVADGLTEGLIAELARVPVLRVVSTDGVAPYRTSELPRDSIARALGAGTLIVGSVEPDGPAGLRVNTRLLEGGSGADIGRRMSTRIPLDALSTAQDSVARDVGLVLREWLGAEIEGWERRAGTRSSTAWTLYQRAERLRKEGESILGPDALPLLDRADSLLAEAEDADGEWVDPIVLRADVARIRAQRGPPPDEAVSTLEAGIAHAERALGRTPNHAGALALRGTLRYLMWFREHDPSRRERLLETALRDLEEAVAVDGTRASAYATLSHLHHVARKDLVSAALAAQNAYTADAFLRNADAVLERLFLVHYHLANFPDARRWCDEGGRRFREDWRFVHCRLYLQITPDAVPDPESAWALAMRIDSITPEHRRAFWERHSRQLVAGVLARAGYPDSARTLLLNARTLDPEIDPERELPGFEAVIRAQMGDADTAIVLLREYVAVNPDHFFQRDGTIHWWWMPIRDYPEFRRLLAARP